MSAQDTLQILINGEPAQSFQFIALTLANTGNTDFTPEDFVVPLSLDFGSNAKILSVTVTKKNPQNLNVSVMQEGSLVKIPPTLINKGENFSIQVVGTNLQQTPTVDGRVVGVSNIPISFNSPDGNPFISNILASVVGIVATLIAIDLVGRLEKRLRPPDSKS